MDNPFTDIGDRRSPASGSVEAGVRRGGPGSRPAHRASVRAVPARIRCSPDRHVCGPGPFSRAAPPGHAGRGQRDPDQAPHRGVVEGGTAADLEEDGAEDGRGRSRHRPREGRLALFGTKGGVGTTSLATNLAVEMHRVSRKKTLLLDLDVELGETSLMLGMDPKFSLTDLIRNFPPGRRGAPGLVHRAPRFGIDLLAAPFKPGDYESRREGSDSSDHPVSAGPVRLRDHGHAQELSPGVDRGARRSGRGLPHHHPHPPGDPEPGSLPAPHRQFTSGRREHDDPPGGEPVRAGRTHLSEGDRGDAGMPVLHTIRNDYEAVMGGSTRGDRPCSAGTPRTPRACANWPALVTDTPVSDDGRAASSAA
jgi:hypothetical protein